MHVGASSDCGVCACQPKRCEHYNPAGSWPPKTRRITVTQLGRVVLLACTVLDYCWYTCPRVATVQHEDTDGTHTRASLHFWMPFATWYSEASRTCFARRETLVHDTPLTTQVWNTAQRAL